MWMTTVKFQNILLIYKSAIITLKIWNGAIIVIVMAAAVVVIATVVAVVILVEVVGVVLVP